MLVVKPIVFNSLLFERESEASYYDSSGDLVWAAADEIRLGYNPETLDYIGAVIETASENRLLYSNDFTNAAWTKSTFASITNNAHPSPEGVTNAASFSGGNISQEFVGGSINNAGFSIFVKQNGASAYPAVSHQLRLTLSSEFSSKDDVVFNFYSDHAPVIDSKTSASLLVQVQTLQNGWFRISIYRFQLSFRVILDALSGSFYLYGAMTEFIPLSFYGGTSYIRTSGTTVTRDADVQNNPPSLAYSNVPEPDYTEWDEDTEYDPDDLVTVMGNYNRNYRCINAITSTPATAPYVDTTNWVDIGATKRWRAFDYKVGADLQSTNNDIVEYSMTVDRKCDALILFNVAGSTARAVVNYGGNVIYEQEIDIRAPVTESKFWNYFFEERRQIKDVAFLNLPPSPGGTVTVTVEGVGECAIGKIVLGSSRNLGFAEFGNASIGINNFSTKERDPFGNYFVQPRRFVGKKSVRTVVTPGAEIAIKDTLAQYKDDPCAYVVETMHEPILTFGFCNNFEVLFSTVANSYCSQEIEGI